jgi:peptide/nickel transport system substrate-binding protein
MVKSQGRWARSLAYGATALLVIAACAGNTATPAPPTAPTGTTAPAATPTAKPATSTTPQSAPPSTSTASSTPGTSAAPSASTSTESTSPGGSGSTGTKGGTIYMLKNATDFDYYDPQRVYTGEDLAFFGATTMRGLVSYIYSPDPAVGVTIQPDMATDLGTHDADAKTWSFTLRDGLTWQDGSPVKCEDIKYGVSRTFATDVINGGPTYAIAYLAIPKAADGTSAYKGPYTGEGQDLFDQAVVCDGNTITFHLAQTVSDFNFTTTLGMFAVPNPTDHPGIDLGENYVGDKVWSDGPYQITSYTPDAGGSLILDRNPNWNAASDPNRPAYPDKWEVDFGLDLTLIDGRLMQSTGNDAFAIDYGGVQPQNLTTVFSDAHTAAPQFAGRAFSDFDPYTRYYWINTASVKDLAVRQAMAVALDRASVRTNAGGDFVGDYADGAIKPNIGQDYAPTGFWDTMLGEAVPDNGDPAFAKQILSNAGITPPTLTWNYAISPTGDKNAAIVQKSLQNAGFKVKIAGIDPAHYYSTVFDNSLKGDFGTGGWGADWPNATTVIPDLFTDEGGWNLSNVEDGVGGAPADWNAQVKAAQTTVDRNAQSLLWQQLNSAAMQNVFIIPTFFGLAQDMGGTNVGNLYRWSAYGSWPYAQLYVKGS